MAGLAKYFSKRHFTNTPEPRGRSGEASGKKLVFVVQEHHASHLHYDFRLELDGVLKSWAVPKGPSMDPHVRHLAVQVEDHPYDYRKFKGTIPKGNYGAGTVAIWDEGTYEPREGGGEEALRKGLQKGHLTFLLYGKRLKGEFALIKLKKQEPGKKNAWLLVKKDDQFAVPEGQTNRLTLESSDQPDITMYPKKSIWKATPMLATLVNDSFSKIGWIFEIKWDGYRAIGVKNGPEAQLYSRSGKDFRYAYPMITEALGLLKRDVILDGEIIVTDEKGRPHFDWLQTWKEENPRGSLRYYVFDILWCDGYDVREMPLFKRKQLLRSVVPAKSIIHYSSDIKTEGEKLFDEVRRRGLEGIVAKRSESQYLENKRGADWLKIKTHQRQEVVIGGFTEPRGERKFLGSLIVGVYDKGELIYVGHSGGGIPEEERKNLRKKLDKLERGSSPFKYHPLQTSAVHWVKPELVCEMSFSEWTAEGYMRQPVFEGMRQDKSSITIKREKPSRLFEREAGNSKTFNRRLQLTNLDKVFFPNFGYTKGDLIDYYTETAGYILPYLKNRPHSLLRQPNGIRGESFFQKNIEHLPSWIPVADIYSQSNRGNLHWIVGGNLETLLYMVQLGCIEINPWNSRIQQLSKPDWSVIDLDPENISFEYVVRVAKVVRDVCESWEVPCLPKTSGKTGIHIYIPLQANYSDVQARNLAHLIAIEVNKIEPKLTSLERMPGDRKSKVYLDYLQNREGQTLAAPYSVRPSAKATISMPLHWDEVKADLDPDKFTILTAITRMRRVGDIWKPVLEKGVDLEKLLKILEKSGAGK
jgi:bifunctional non-homologous end joining protein LigD